MQLRRHSPSASEFALAYTGDALSEHIFDALDLASVVTAMDSLVQRSNEVINRSTNTASLYVSANRPGSFDIEFLLSITPVVATSLGNDPISDATNFIRLLFGSDSPGLFTVIKWLKGRRPDVATTYETNLTIEADRLIPNPPKRWAVAMTQRMMGKGRRTGLA